MGLRATSIDLYGNATPDAKSSSIADRQPPCRGSNGATSFAWAALKAAPVQIEAVDGGHVLVCGYRPYDPLLVPAPIVHVLHVFDGRPTKQAMTAAKESGVPLNRRVVRRLVDFGILVDATG